jgi:hypothetical protein
LATPGVELPRELPGPLNLTEAFEAFLLVALDAQEGPVVRVRTLAPPVARAGSTLPSPVQIPRAAVIATASQLREDPLETLPSALPCGGRLLTAAELLLALAGVVRGEDPVTVRPIEVPDPNAPGLGWGAAGLP